MVQRGKTKNYFSMAEKPVTNLTLIIVASALFFLLTMVIQLNNNHKNNKTTSVSNPGTLARTVSANDKPNKTEQKTIYELEHGRQVAEIAKLLKDIESKIKNPNSPRKSIDTTERGQKVLTKDVQKLNTKDDFILVQKTLKEFGYYHKECDGNRNDTLKALRKFQNDIGVDVDGKLGKNTFDAMRILHSQMVNVLN